VRLFIATSFPDALIEGLNQRIATIKPKLPPASWVRPETQHLTFAFLGEQDQSIVDRLSLQLTVPKFEAVLHGCGFFPNARRARVGWIGLEPEEPFQAVAREVREAVKREGIELDRANFRAHLTIMRIREGWPPASIEMFERALRDYRSAPFVVESVTLYSSQLDPGGAIHTAVRTFALA
jgi:2'-5' RNA ligase